MLLLTPEQAREQALRDWESRSALNLVVGTIDITLPRFHLGDLFYSDTLSCEISDEAELYCKTYNATIRSLLRKYGVPVWAPVKRLPDAFSCLTVLANEAFPFSTYQPASPEEESLRDRILFYWGSTRPLVYVRMLQPALLLWGGPLPDQSGRVDVLDCLRGIQWMAFYVYPRIEFPQLPWDGQ